MPTPNYGEFVQIPQNTFNEIAVEAGLLLSTFDPTGATPIANEHILCATTGGVSASCTRTDVDNGADIDNCPPGMAELMDVDTWECKVGFNALNATPALMRLGLGAADSDEENPAKVVPSMTIKPSHFQDIWLVLKRKDGGYAAVHLLNALSTSGLTMQTTKKGKAQFTHELTGHFSINNQSKVPMEWYAQSAPVAETASQTNAQNGGNNE